MRGPQPWQTSRSRGLRSRQTAAEEKLWDELRGCRLNGLKFVRQAAVGAHFVDDDVESNLPGVLDTILHELGEI